MHLGLWPIENVLPRWQPNVVTSSSVFKQNSRTDLQVWPQSTQFLLT